MVDGFTDSLNFFSSVLGDADVKFFFQLHHQFNGVQRVSTQVVYKIRLARDFVFFNPKLLRDNVFYLIFDRRYVSASFLK